MAPRLLITAGSSYLGRHLVRLVAAGYPGEFRYTTFSTDPPGLPQHVPLDVRDRLAVDRLVVEFAPEVIIHLAGSNRSADMSAVIVAGTGHISRAAAAIGARLIHLSTDSIFDGRSAPYDETAPAAPLNDYGRAKAAAEDIVAGHPDHVIVRTSLIYGLDEMDNGTAWVAAALREGQPVTLFTNQRRNPVWVETLSRACLELVDHPYRGVVNVAGRQVLTRVEFGLRLLDWWGIDERDALRLGPDESGRWPLDCEMDVRLAGRVLATPMLGVDEVLGAQPDRPASLNELA